METKKLSNTRILVECAIFIAIATVLSIIKIIDLPYGGSVTVASMLPIVVISYRHGLKWGLWSGFAFGAIQQLLGLKTLSYVTTWQSVLAVVMLDYIIAFAVIGFAGVFRHAKKQSTALVLGSLLVCLLRYICHVASGATVWAGLSIPTEAALQYSFAYNATYMVPETIVLTVVAYYFGSVFDLRRELPVRVIRERQDRIPVFKWVAGLVLTGMAIFDTVLVFSKLQDGETGDFYIKGLSDVDWLAFGIVTGVCVAAATALVIISGRRSGEKSE